MRSACSLCLLPVHVATTRCMQQHQHCINAGVNLGGCGGAAAAAPLALVTPAPALSAHSLSARASGAGAGAASWALMGHRPWPLRSGTVRRGEPWAADVAARCGTEAAGASRQKGEEYQYDAQPVQSTQLGPPQTHGHASEGLRRRQRALRCASAHVTLGRRVPFPASPQYQRLDPRPCIANSIPRRPPGACFSPARLYPTPPRDEQGAAGAEQLSPAPA